MAAVERVEVVDPHTVRFHFERVYSTQLLDAATFAVIFPKHAWGTRPFSEWRDDADWFREHLVVSGPFDLASWTPQQEIVLQRNPLYYRDGLPHLERVIFRVVPDQTNQFTQLLNGQADYVLQLSPDDVARVESAPGADVLSYWTRGYITVGWNLRRAELADPLVRRALTHGIDRQTLVDSIWGEYARPLDGPIPEEVWAHDAALEPLDYDPDEARRLLAAAGWEDGDGDGVREKAGRPLRLRLITNAGNRQREDAAVLIQDQLRRVGVAVVPEVLEFNTMIQQALAGDFDGLLFGSTLPTTMDLRFAFHSEEIESGNNIVAYANPEVDRLLDEIGAQPTHDDAKPLLDRLQRLIQEEQPYTFLWQSQRLVGVRERVHGAAPNHLFNLWLLEEWWVDPPR
jgi:peptide/nickel transport system substrate-binding protein